MGEGLYYWIMDDYITGLLLWGRDYITGGMGKECIRYHSRLAELIAAKKGEQYSQTISWIRARTSFALLRSALVCLRGSR